MFNLRSTTPISICCSGVCARPSPIHGSSGLRRRRAVSPRRLRVSPVVAARSSGRHRRTDAHRLKGTLASATAISDAQLPHGNPLTCDRWRPLEAPQPTPHLHVHQQRRPRTPALSPFRSAAKKQWVASSNRKKTVRDQITEAFELKVNLSENEEVKKREI